MGVMMVEMVWPHMGRPEWDISTPTQCHSDLACGALLCSQAWLLRKQPFVPHSP